jgi:hypothetical protein
MPSHVRRASAAGICIVVLGLAISRCATLHPSVTMENPAPSADFPATILPPSCHHMPMPDYPPDWAGDPQRA